MIFEFHPGRQLTIDCPYPEARSVIQGNNPGWVFGDKPINPQTVLVWSQGIRGFYLIGNRKNEVFLNELNTFISCDLKSKLIQHQVTWIEICGGPNWDNLIEKMFSDRNLEKSKQLVYKLDLDDYKLDKQPEINGEYQLLKINQDILNNSSLVNKKFLLSKLSQFWGTSEDFLDRGLGYILTAENQIASLCFSGFVTEDIRVIDIETVKFHRRKGFAVLVAQVFLSECVHQGLHIHWDCMEENIASVKLAEKLGLVKRHEYTLYSFHLD